MNALRRAAAACCLLLLSPPAHAADASSSAGRTLVHAGRLIDGAAATVREAVTVVIAGGRIQAVEAGYTAPRADDTVIELKDHTVMPGWIDAHVHLGTEPSPQA